MSVFIIQQQKKGGVFFWGGGDFILSRTLKLPHLSGMHSLLMLSGYMCFSFLLQQAKISAVHAHFDTDSLVG